MFGKGYSVEFNKIEGMWKDLIFEFISMLCLEVIFFVLGWLFWLIVLWCLKER